ncbi:MAG: protein translocase subunit SecF [Acidimicrobiales bacterium]
MSTAQETVAPDGRAPAGGRFHRLYYGQTKFDFVRRRRIWFAISSVIIGAGIISLAVRGLNYDIEFVGGTAWQVADNNGVTVSQAQAAVSAAGVSNATVTTLGNSGHTSLEVEAKLSNGRGSVGNAEQSKVSAALARLTHTSAASVSVEAVGPTWGGQVTHKAVEALIVFIVMISAYISIFFEWKMALAAIIAVLHDIMVTVGIYSLTFFLVTPDTVVAFLTVLGYSLYDTIVVFDRIRDNTKGLGATGKLSFTDVVNLSMNQTLARSINTSLVAILPILSVLVLGADILGATTLEYFGLALLIGLTSGAYSSIFIASPLVAMLKEREPRYTQIRQRLEARSGAVQLLTPAAVAAGILDEREQRGATRRQGKGRATVPQGGPIRPRASAGGQTSTALLDEPARDGVDADPGMASAEGLAPESSPARAPTGAPRPRQPQKGATAARPRKKKRH